MQFSYIVVNLQTQMSCIEKHCKVFNPSPHMPKQKQSYFTAISSEYEIALYTDTHVLTPVSAPVGSLQ